MLKEASTPYHVLFIIDDTNLNGMQLAKKTAGTINTSIPILSL